MRTKILTIATVLFVTQLTTAQVLCSEDFDNYTLGNLGTDPTGVIPGQGDWSTNIFYSTTPYTPNNSAFAITNEIFKGKVLTFTAQKNESLTATKNLSTLVDKRTIGNDVIKFEIDYYTGSQYYMATSRAPYIEISLMSNNNNKLLTYSQRITHGFFHGRSSNGLTDSNGVKLGNDIGTDSLPVDTWVSLIVYLDYNNKKIYFDTPYFSKVAVGDFLNLSTSNNLIEDFKPTAIRLYSDASIANGSQMVHKFDNIKITGLKVVPPNIIALSTNEQLAQKFNVFPNPANNIVNITNNENMAVQQVTIYDVTGKQLIIQSFNGESDIQLNVESLSNGTYMLHIQSDSGTTLKKLIKK